VVGVRIEVSGGESEREIACATLTLPRLNYFDNGTIGQWKSGAQNDAWSVWVGRDVRFQRSVDNRANG
jgi:hypothetical protein